MIQFKFNSGYSIISDSSARMDPLSLHDALPISRAARRRMQEIQRLTPKQRYERQTEKYRELIGVTEEVVDSAQRVDRKSTRLNSSHRCISYAVFCLKKKNGISWLVFLKNNTRFL